MIRTYERLEGVISTMTDEDLQSILDEIVSFIRDYTDTYGFAPSLREIGEHCHIGRTTVSRYLDKLVIQGRITRMAGRARSLHVIEPDDPPAT